MIHVSESTAVALRKVGREEWLSPREDHTDVKGMPTYFVSFGMGEGTSLPSIEAMSRMGRSESGLADIGENTEAVEEQLMERLSKDVSGAKPEP